MATAITITPKEGSSGRFALGSSSTNSSMSSSTAMSDEPCYDSRYHKMGGGGGGGGKGKGGGGKGGGNGGGRGGVEGGVGGRSGGVGGETQIDPKYLLAPPTPQYMLGTKQDKKYVCGDGNFILGVPPSDSKYFLGGHPGNEGYWHIPRAALWCQHKGCNYDNQPCNQCQWKDECASQCSSVNPPPTFTALDNYQPVQRKSKYSACGCGIVFVVTSIFSLLVLALIAAFIVYIEIVLKHQTENVTDRM